MKPIKVIDAKGNQCDVTPICEALVAVNKLAHNIEWSTVYQYALNAEERLRRMGLPGVARPGARYVFEGGDALPRAYSKKATHVERTAIVLTRRASGWYLTAVDRLRKFSDTPPTMRLELTKEQDDIAVKVLRRSYTVQEDEST